ncbi:MAG: hypothetical protein H6Q69_1754 [Firmicutes bacterium]|nr:hypothetical protein [Bacillota bacterium]
MKRIFLFIFALLFVFSSTTFAQEGKVYEFNDCLTVTFPEEWPVDILKETLPLLNGTSPNKSPSITLRILVLTNKSLDEFMIDIKEDIANHIKLNFRLEESQNLYIDDHEARLLIYSMYSPYGVKFYQLIGYFYSDQHNYGFYATGPYVNLGSDREIINSILSSIKILK